VATSEPVVVVSQAFAERRYPGRLALGAALTYRGWFGEPHTARIVGIARNANYHRINTGPSTSLRNPAEDIFYQPLAQTSPVSPTVTLVVRTTGDPNSLAGLVRRTLDGISGVKAARITSVGAVLNDMTARERFGADLGGAFAATALLLATIGVYGVLSYSVVRRTRELGVRTALGARTRDNVRLVLGEALVMVGVGIVAGLPLAVGVSRISQSLLYGVSPWDPRALVGGVALLTVVALVGGLLPARRATRIDPLVALRSE
jgi:putative ABC transport system permease protein